MADGSSSIEAVTVYCSSSNLLDQAYFAAARAMGEGLAVSGRDLVYGGGCVGLMGELARSCRGAGGRVVGIITERLRDAEQLDPENHENVIVRTMRERKALLEQRGDAIVVLPGGLGTLEEFFEILVGRLLGEHDKPIFVLNMDDPNEEGRYYDPLLRMFDHMVNSRFAKAGIRELFEMCECVEDVLEGLNRVEREPPSDRAKDRSHLIPSNE